MAGLQLVVAELAEPWLVVRKQSQTYQKSRHFEQPWQLVVELELHKMVIVQLAVVERELHNRVVAQGTHSYWLGLDTHKQVVLGSRTASNPAVIGIVVEVDQRNHLSWVVKQVEVQV